MAYRRCVAERAKLLYHHQRLTPSFSYITHQDDHNNPSSGASNSAPSRCFGTMDGPRNLFQRYPLRSAAWGAWGSGFGGRNMSTTPGAGPGEEGELVSNLDVFLDGSVESVAAQVAPAVNEVAVAAADSFLPIAGLQYFIEYVHVFTGLNWWASIVATTFFIRLCLTPLMINQLKATSKFTLLRPKLEEVRQEMQERGMSPDAVSEGQAKMKALFKEFKVTPFTPLKGLLIQGPVFISFFLAIKNMAENVPSFHHGGAYWFVDLTTPDTMYIFPLLTALTFWMTVEFNMQDGMEGNPAAKTIKNVSRVFAVLTVPLTASFAKAIFCYWISANVFSLMYGVVIKNPKVKELLGVPIIPFTPPPPNSQPSGLTFSDALKKFAAAKAYEGKNTFTQEVKQEAEQQSLASASPSEESEGINQKLPSSATLSQRIRILEEEVKARKEELKKR